MHVARSTVGYLSDSLSAPAWQAIPLYRVSQKYA